MSYGTLSYVPISIQEGKYTTLPVYMLLLTERLLDTIATKMFWRDAHLKIVAEHDHRYFRVWLSHEEEKEVVIEERVLNEWILVYRYRAI